MQTVQCLSCKHALGHGARRRRRRKLPAIWPSASQCSEKRREGVYSLYQRPERQRWLGGATRAKRKQGGWDSQASQTEGENDWMLTETCLEFDLNFSSVFFLFSCSKFTASFLLRTSKLLPLSFLSLCSCFMEAHALHNLLLSPGIILIVITAAAAANKAYHFMDFCSQFPHLNLTLTSPSFSLFSYFLRAGGRWRRQ